VPEMHFPSGNNGIGHDISVHRASLLLPLDGQVQVLQPSDAVHDKWGQQWSSGSAGSSGTGSCCAGRVKHLKLVQAASLFKPLHGHKQVFNPSPAGNGMPGVHLPSGTAGPDGAGHFMRVHADSFFMPLAGQTQVLHPSGAVQGACGQQRSAGIGSSSVGSSLGSVEHCRRVQLALLFKPLPGHMQVFRPSPAGKAMPAMHLPSGSARPICVGQRIREHRASLFFPLLGHVQALHPSVAVNTV